MVANDFLKLSSGTYSTISDFNCSSLSHLRKFCICHKLWWHVIFVKGHLLQSASVNLQWISFLTPILHLVLAGRTCMLEELLKL